jgi:preprotein translocase SecE subunit
MIGIIAVIDWGAVRFMQTDAGRYAMRGIAWLVSSLLSLLNVPTFSREQFKEMLESGEAVSWLTKLPHYIDSTGSLYFVAGIIGLLGIWFAFRIVNMPRPAEFMIAVEAEMVKVSWPNKKEVYVTTIVVIVVMMIFCVLLAIYDLIWHYLFHWMGII